MLILNDILSKKSLLFTGFISLFISLYIGQAGLLFATLIGSWLIFSEFMFFLKGKSYFPYIFFIFSPITLIHFSSVRDFKIRIFSFIFISYIIAFAMNKYSGFITKLNEKKSNKLTPLKIWGIAFILFSMTSVFLFYKGVYLAGDEPHFLTISQSIVDDWDFELSNNYSEKSFYVLKPELKNSGWKISPHITMHNKFMRSFHMPGVSFLMTPFYEIYKILGYPIHPAIFFRFATAFYNAFFALSLFYLLNILFKDKNVFFFWIIIISSFPLLLHSTTIFPEIPAALMAINIFIFGFTKYKNYLLTGLFLALLPWFHVKYYPLVLIFTIAVFIELYKDWKVKKEYKNLIKFLLFPAISLVLLMIYCKILYGTVNPTLIFPKQNYFVNFTLKIKVFFAYFIDQQDGLITYAPYLILLFFGLKFKFKHRALLLTAALSYVTLHAFTTVRGAYAPAGRPLIFVIWIFILFVANFYFNDYNEKDKKSDDIDYLNSWKNYSFKILTGLTYFFTAWFFYYPFFMFQPVFSGTTKRASDLFNFLGSDTINLPSLFPSFITHTQKTYIPNIIWIVLLVVIIALFYLTKPNTKTIPINRKKLQTVISLIIFILFSYAFSFYPHIHLQEKNMFKIGTIPIYKTAKLFHYLDDINDSKNIGKRFRLKEGYNYDLYIDISSWKNKQKSLRFVFDSNEKTNLSIFSKKELIIKSLNKKKTELIIKLSNLKKLTIKNRLYALLTLSTKKTKNNTHIYLKILPKHK